MTPAPLFRADALEYCLKTKTNIIFSAFSCPVVPVFSCQQIIKIMSSKTFNKSFWTFTSRVCPILSPCLQYFIYIFCYNVSKHTTRYPARFLLIGNFQYWRAASNKKYFRQDNMGINSKSFFLALNVRFSIKKCAGWLIIGPAPMLCPWTVLFPNWVPKRVMKLQFWSAKVLEF